MWYADEIRKVHSHKHNHSTKKAPRPHRSPTLHLREEQARPSEAQGHPQWHPQLLSKGDQTRDSSVAAPWHSWRQSYKNKHTKSSLVSIHLPG